MIGQYQVGAGADHEVVSADAARGQGIHLRQQHLGIEGHTRPDQAAGLLVEDAGWHQVEGELPPRVDDGMAGVVAALRPYDDVRATCQQVDDFTLALVTPLTTDDGEYRHRSTPKGDDRPKLANASHAPLDDYSSRVRPTRRPSRGRSGG